jgi:NADP-dependent 3-hydroxy acid dehydrogenase YdfG
VEHIMQGVVVVTGASARIGEAIAARLLDEGRTVVAVQRRRAALRTRTARVSRSRSR